MEFSTDILTHVVELAKRGLGHTRPNPPVGAMLFSQSRKVLGEGYHHRAGENHAEVEAIKDWQENHPSLKPHTLLVTLEPCSKAGKVGACTEAIIRAQIPHVVYLCEDPNPKNRRKAKKALELYGITCEFRPYEPAADLIKPFAKRIKTGIPYVTVKLAISLDGKICDNWGDAKWISSKESREATGKLREQVDAIMVGASTVRQDNPSLLAHGKANPDLIRVVISRSGRLPETAQVFTDGKNKTLVYPSAQEALRDLGAKGITHVLCEGGRVLAASLNELGVVDEWITVLCPITIGENHIKDAKRFGKLKDTFVCLQA